MSNNREDQRSSVIVHNPCPNIRFGDEDALIETNLGNRYGSLKVSKLNGVPYVCVGCEVDLDRWRPCSQELYNAIAKEMQPGGSLAFIDL